VNEHWNQAKTVVAAITSREDQGRLRGILRFPEWKVQVVQSLRSLSAAVKTCSGCVVIAGTRLRDGRSWKDVLDDMEGLWNRPQLIVADRLASEALWAEVLNLGAYDLLATPSSRQKSNGLCRSHGNLAFGKPHVRATVRCGRRW